MQKDDLAGLADKPGRSPANRSLERGIEILRAFRPGSELLANGDLAERTGLSRSTVSRLTQTLVGAGMLQLDAAQRAYRLAPAVLSLAHAMRSGSNVLAIAAPKMRALAERERINVGLAAPDRDEMVYLESIRYARRHALSQRRLRPARADGADFVGHGLSRRGPGGSTQGLVDAIPKAPRRPMAADRGGNR